MDADELFELIRSHDAVIKKLQLEMSSLGTQLTSLQEEQKETEQKDETQAQINEIVKRQQAAAQALAGLQADKAELQQRADPTRPRSIEELTAEQIRASKPKKKAKEEPEEEPSAEASASSVPIPPLPPPPTPPRLEGRTTASVDSPKPTNKPHFDVKGMDARGKEKQVIIRDANDEEAAKRLAASRHDIQFVTSIKRNKVSESIAAASAKRRGTTAPTAAPPPGSASGTAAPFGPIPSNPKPFVGDSLTPPAPGGPSPPSGPIMPVHDAQMFALVEKIQEKIATGGGSTPSAPTPAPGSPGGPPLPLFTPEEERVYARKKRGKLWRQNKNLGGTREDVKVGGTLAERRSRRLEKLQKKKNFGTRIGAAAKRLGQKAAAGAPISGLATEGVAEIAAFAGPIGEFAAAVAAFGVGVYEFARHQEQEIRRQAEFGPRQAVGIAELDAHRMQRDIKTADETGASSQALTQAIDRLEDTLQPVVSLLENVGNVTGVGLVEALNLAITTMTPMVKVLNALLRHFTGAGEDTTNWALIESAAKRAETRDPSWARRTP